MKGLKHFFIFCLALGVLASCVQNPKSVRRGYYLEKTVPNNPTAVATSIQAASTGLLELRQIVNPYTGTYESKVSIPKNFTGTLYLSALNASSALADKHVYVRFKFGRELESVTIPATIGRASGITPQSDKELIILRMNGRPFENMRLLYDLYDYNEYSSSGVPVTDPKNVGLYCRGLKLEHDPTFQGNLSNTSCDAANERCLYAYAKVVDSGLYKYNAASSTWLGLTPTTIQADTSSKTIGYQNYITLTASNTLSVCLPDYADNTNLNGVLGGVMGAVTGTSTWDTSILVGGTEYRYRGPYRPVSQNLWQISSSAIFSDLSVSGTTPSGLFQKTLIPGDARGGYQSFMFPRAMKRSLRANVQYWGATSPFDLRTLSVLSTSGSSDYMDGCNARLVDTAAYSQEAISSCNVSGVIEIISKDISTGTETVMASTSEVKLQLVRASETDYYGDEVVYSSMNSCNSSYACGSSQCCFNNRCWSKNYVSQCPEDVDATGNVANGKSCKTDFDCASLCCDQTTNTCKVHYINNDGQSLCQKPAGKECVAKEWCSQVNIVQYRKVKYQPDPITGSPTCRWIPDPKQIFMDCKNGICVQPVMPTPAPTGNILDCSDAVDP